MDLRAFVTTALISTFSSVQGIESKNKLYSQSNNANGKGFTEPQNPQSIVGGQVASAGEFPSFVQYNGGACGATLIHKDIVIGAAHCSVPNDGILHVKGSEIDTNKGDALGIVESAVVHPFYENSGVDYDFLIMKLQEPVPDSIVPSPLNDDPNNPQQSEMVTAIGYGVSCMLFCSELQPQLFKVDVRYYMPWVCNLAYGGIIKNDIHLCAASFGKDTCQGDSGGPIFDSERKLLGITSFGYGCATLIWPGVYSRISGEIDWINEMICCLSDYPPEGCVCPEVSTLTVRDESVCFSPYATAMVKGEGKVAMKDLAVGKYVLTASGKYRQIFSTLHFNDLETTNFLQIHTDNEEQPIELSPRHMIFVEGRSLPTPAAQIKIGDLVKTLNGEKKVTSIKRTKHDGFYNPLTADGTIVVDGIIASTFASVEEGTDFLEIWGVRIISQQSFLSIAYTPYRLMCEGVSLELCKVHDPLYNKIGRNIFRIWRKQHMMLQCIIFFGFASTLGLFNVAINSLGLCLIVLAAIFIVRNRFCTKCRIKQVAHNK